jgi:hypothetical protein
MFDNLTVFMCCVVTFVSSLVHLYSIEYKQKFMTNTNKLFIDNLKILAKIFPVKKMQRYKQETTIVLPANNFLDGLLFFKNNTLFQFKLLTCISGVGYLFLFTFFMLIFVTFAGIDYSSVIGLNSCLNCDAPEDWQTNIAETSHNCLSFDLILMLMLTFGLTCIVVSYLIKPFFYPYKQRKAVMTVIVDSYIYLFIGVMSRSVPHRFTMTTLSLGSFINRSLYLHGYMNLKLAIILAFVLPMICFMTFLCMSMLPFYLA